MSLTSVLKSNQASRSPSASSNVSALKCSKGAEYMQWWFLGPVVLAIFMFLLMGTIFERRIEIMWRQLLERRQAMTTQGTDEQEQPLTANSNHSIITPSQMPEQRNAGNAQNCGTNEPMSTTLHTSLRPQIYLPKNMIHEKANGTIISPVSNIQTAQYEHLFK